MKRHSDIIKMELNLWMDGSFKVFFKKRKIEKIVFFANSLKLNFLISYTSDTSHTWMLNDCEP